MIKLFIIADDFTGALDTGVQFAEYGTKTLVETAPMYDFSQMPDGTEVLVLNAETRHLLPDQAYAVVYRAVREARNAGIPYIYKKTDSALRGNIGSELAAAMDAAELDRMAFVPAFPVMGRITRGGIHYVDGIPIAQSVFGRDPFEPVHSSDIPKIVAAQTALPVVLHLKTDSTGTWSQPGIQLYDADSDEDLWKIARDLTLENLRLSAGCAGFAAVLDELLELRGKPTAIPPLTPALFVVCGSINPVTQQQMKTAELNGFSRFCLGPLEKLDPLWLESTRCEQTVRSWLDTAARNRCCILDSNDSDGGMETDAFIRLHGLTKEQVRLRISAALATLTRRMVDGGLNATLMCTGGDTLLALMREMGVTELMPVCELSPGVVLSAFAYQGKSIHIISKSGGFGAPDLLCSLAALTGITEQGKEHLC
ncbi:four-carbon acid sugar kinase family protein [Oscillibacter sp.]|uniref:four-carbon acid sugar kinase family protein n=1 Tax=Oscillibacter sp. TaxID=1945593 RepID=UPI0028A25997|nr:four-carbon acid sugar kinase family protein [Oscillibacter sp.]